jgi:hypothetical protein
VKIQWVYQDDAGFWDSFEERFSVSPIYMSRTTPQGYELRDALKTHKNKGIISGVERETHIYPGFWTVREAKAKAESILLAERERK